MTKDVLVSISGMHAQVVERPDILVEYEEEENSPIEVVTPASYYLKNGKHYIVYDEYMEGSSTVTKNKIKITGHESVDIMKTGEMNVHMNFEKGRKNLSYYKTPYGQMLVGVNTRSLEITETEDHIGINIGYELEVNHEPMAECNIKLNIYSKESAPL